MILTGPEIGRERDAQRIHIEPFDRAQLTTNSYDFRLGRTLLRYQHYELDSRKENATVTIDLDDGGYVLRPGRIYLGHTVEVMGSDHFVPIIRAKSSTARLGLFVHVTADIIDIGSRNQWTLQLNAVQPVRVYPEMLIGQVTFWKVFGDIVLYDGKYQGSRGPVASLIHRDMGVDMESSRDHDS